MLTVVPSSRPAAALTCGHVPVYGSMRDTVHSQSCGCFLTTSLSLQTKDN